MMVAYEVSGSVEWISGLQAGPSLLHPTKSGCKVLTGPPLNLTPWTLNPPPSTPNPKPLMQNPDFVLPPGNSASNFFRQEIAVRS